MSALFRLANYQLEDRLGPEGAVETYRARIAEGTHAGTEAHRFAVKVLRADRVRGDSYSALAARFMAAGQRLLAAQGSGMARVVEVNQDALGAFVASEFVVGVDLAGLLKAAQAQSPDRRASLDPAVAGVVGAKLARVLAGAHRQAEPLYHLGLCPGNVVVTLAGEVVVLDFGLFATVRGLVEHGIDKWSFVAPELLGADLGDGRPTDGAAADLFALGGLLFYLLSGRPPVEAPSLADLYDRTWEPLPELAGVPDRLNAAIRALTAPDPQDRCQAAEQALAWLTSVGDASPPAPSNPLRDDLGRDGAKEGAATLASAAASPTASRPKTAGHPSHGAVATIGKNHSARSEWLAPLVLVGVVLVLMASLLAFRLARTFAAKRAAQGVAIAQRRSGEAPAGEPQVKSPSRRRSPESWMPAVPTPLPDAAPTRAIDAAPRRGENDPIPVLPAGRFVVEESDTPAPERVPNHLYVDTQPHGATVWVDGAWKGNTPLDILTGAGSKQLALVTAGHHMARAGFDAGDGAIIRVALDPVIGPVRGDAFLNVVCRTPRRYPVFVDDEETGLLCPVSRIPVLAGTHRVGVFVPPENRMVAVEITVPAGPKPVEVRLAP